MANNVSMENRIELASSAINLARDSIVVKLRYLDSAVYALRPVLKESQGLAAGTIAAGRELHDYGISTNGVSFLYEPNSILRRCSDGIDRLTHDYLHVLLHCIFLHFKPNEDVDQDLWSLAADIAVEETIRDMAPGLSMTGGTDELQRFRQQLGELTAERLYNYFVKIKLRRLRMEQLSVLFHVDEHDEWYDPVEIPITVSDEEGIEADSGIPRPGDVTEESDDGETDWERISDNIRMAIDMRQLRDDQPGERFAETLRTFDEKLISYRDFLRHFTTIRENMKVDDAAWDNIFYTYGLELYGDMPLIEPLETREEKRVYDCVIVIDSSASTSGELVESFVRKTFELLGDDSAIGARFNIRLIQCDDRIREDVVLHSKDDAERYLERMKIRGQGGTDFRVAFQHVEELQKNGAFNNLKGLIYFTDGKGVFPARKPPYETAFVFTDKYSAAGIKVPVWAIKAVMEDE